MQSSDALECLDIEINGQKFAPKMVYQIFPDEKILGHTNPRITIKFNDAYESLFEFTSDSSVKSATDVEGELKSIMGPYGTFSKQDWNPEAKQEPAGGAPIAVWSPDYSIRRFKPNELREGSDLLSKLQIFTLFFIEGGSFIDQTDNNWDVFFLFKGEQVQGFATVYPYLYYDSGALFDRKPNLLRKRISQFVILPPYQNKGLGYKFVSALYRHMMADIKTRDITIEDPTEAFDNVRERVCLSLYNKILADLPAEVDGPLLESAAKAAKTDIRSFTQIYEMYLLKTQGETPALKKLIKSRIWRQNYLELKEEPATEQKEKLQLVYGNVIKSYTRVIDSAEFKAKRQRVK